jgi:hypothetical protein
MHTDAFEAYWVGLQSHWGLTDVSIKRLMPEADLVTTFLPPTLAFSDDEALSTVIPSTVEGPGSVASTHENEPDANERNGEGDDDGHVDGHVGSHPSSPSSALSAAGDDEAEAERKSGDLPGSSAGVGPSGVTSDDAQTNDKGAATVLGKRKPGTSRTAGGSSRQPSGSTSRSVGGVKKSAAAKKSAVPRTTPVARSTRAAAVRAQGGSKAQGNRPDVGGGVRDSSVNKDHAPADTPPSHPATGDKSVPPLVAPRGTKRKAAGGGGGRGRPRRCQGS